MAMNLKQTRIVDPVLTNVAVGYSNAEFVGNFIFPRSLFRRKAAKSLNSEKNRSSCTMQNALRPQIAKGFHSATKEKPLSWKKILWKLRSTAAS